jgi:nicotinamidase-related amidase
MANVEIVDRSDMTNKLMDMLKLDPIKTAIVTIDMHRGHLDPEVATMPAAPEDSKRVIENAEDVLGFARSHAVPIIHVKLVFRKIPGLGSEGMPVKFWKALHDISDEANRLSPGRPSTVDDHNIRGSVQQK